MNVGQDLIVITRDRVELCLLKHAGGLEQRKAWLIPFGILVSVALTLATSDTHDWLHLSKDTWKAIFVMLVAGSAVWLAWAVVLAARAKTVDDVIAELQAESKKQAKQTGP